MATPERMSDGQVADACAELRREVGGRCDEAHAALKVHGASGEQTRALKRDLVASRHRLTAALEAADPRLRAAEKATAREDYLQARQLADSDAERTEATADWARSIDRINRTGRLAARAVARGGAQVSHLEEALRGAERAEQTARFRAEAAEAACLDARVRLAACEERLTAGERPGQPTVFQPHAATGGHALGLSEAPFGEPLVIESMVEGDRVALERAAVAIAEHCDLSPAEAQLQLQELVDAILSGASAEGFLAFDHQQPLWAHLTFEEARLVVAALARLGFQFEPAEGWHAGRAPMPADLSVALGYAGLDARHMRDLPSAEELRALPQSIGVDARAFLAARAPDLTVDHMVRLLDRRAAQLEPLWDAWGQIRPILLSDRRSLDDQPS
ncbi:MAG TPA: hypothetical protein VJZ50_04285 [Candidatus Limnocylindrales bacterium]|nr:hypothetical protein [Candidatus Limnocylindrales bacterium]